MKPPKTLLKGIRQHGDGYLVDVMVKRERRTKKVNTYEEAILARYTLAQELKQKDADEKSGRHTWTLEQAFQRTMEQIWQGKSAEPTNQINGQAALKFFGKKTHVDQITLEWIDDYVSTLLKDGNSGSTINRKLSCLSRILRTAKERGKLERVPAMPRRKEGEHRVRFLSREEEAAVLGWLEHIGYEDHRDAVLMLLYTGFRCSELWRLECRDIDLEHETITAWKTKNSHPRTIPIVPTIRPVIDKRMDKVGGTGLLFPGASNEWMRWGWHKVKMGLNFADDPQFVPHMLRHTCATRLAQQGATMMIIKEWMGHSDIQTTARYTHFAPTDLRNAALLLAK